MARYVEYHDDSASSSSLSFSDSDNESNYSRRTHSTATTNYSPRPSIAEGGETFEKHAFHQKEPFRDSGASFASYTSSLDSLHEFYDDADEYEVAPPEQEVYHSEAIPSTPQDFAELFPSSRELLIAHDDATDDGNMNLRIDTIVANARGERKRMILYHLKMNDLKTRAFSFRRHCRDSGREICHSAVRTQVVDAKNKFSFARSISSALSLRSKADVKSSNISGIQRRDSGYDSLHGDNDEPPKSPLSPRSVFAAGSDNVVALEFSNYAHLEIKRQGFSASEKRSDFQYWGVNYSWHKTSSRRAGQESISYNLIRQKDHALVAHIDTIAQTDEEAQEEIEQGGWVPPCSMRIVDKHVLDASGDVADVVVATGLMALVDDSIRRRFHSKTVKQLALPAANAPSSSRHLEFISPKRLIDEAFGRGRRANAAN